jgi:hypothetical protein
MLNYEAIPLLNPTTRYVFEVAAQDENTILQTSILIDAQIEKAQRDAFYEKPAQVPDFTDEIISMTKQAHEAIDHTDRTGEGTWTDYYRLVSQTAFLEQRLKAPFAFDQRGHWKERAQLVNGLYGVSASIINDALLEHDAETATPGDKEQLRGVIQEQTFLALFNKEEQRKHIAVPSATCADLYYKTDADVWILPDRQSEPYFLPIQVKSSIQSTEQRVTPRGGITIVAHEFNNHYNFKISRLIAQDYHYMMGTAPKLTRHQQNELNNAHTQLFDTMEFKAQHVV